MKKLLGFVFALLMTLSVSASAFAGEADPSLATMTFDTNAAFDMWSTYSINDSIATTELTPSIEMENSNTYACMKLSASGVGEETGSIGWAVTAESLGLAEFDNCSFTVSAALPAELSDKSGYSIFSDGGFWSQQPISTDNSAWGYYNLTVPADSHTSVIGFVVPIRSGVEGSVLYIDNFCVFDAEGKQIANVGDTYTSPVEVKTSATEQRATSVLFVVITVVAVLALVGGAAYLFYIFIKRFR